MTPEWNDGTGVSAALAGVNRAASLPPEYFRFGSASRKRTERGRSAERPPRTNPDLGSVKVRMF